MGDRAVITTVGAKDNAIGVYVHLDGCVQSIEAFLAYCDMKGFRCPETDCHGYAYLCTVIGNFFGDGLSLGVEKISRLDCDNYDNGVYYIKDWKIVGRSYDEPLSTDKTELFERLVWINERQGKGIKVSKERIIEYCNREDIPVPANALDNVPAIVS